MTEKSPPRSSGFPDRKYFQNFSYEGLTFSSTPAKTNTLSKLNQPKMKKLFLTAAILGLTFTGAFAGDGKSFKETKNVIEPVDTCRFRDFEVQVDAFYTGFFGGRGTHFSTGSGGGFGLNVFFAKYFGIGYEAAWYDNNNSAQHLPLAGNFFVRYPICSLNLAPYAMVGGGGTWNGHGTGYGNVGAGVEYRFTNNIGIFCDGRYFYGGTGNVANLRSGLRISF